MTLTDRLVDALESTPEMALFLCLALGFAVGKVRVWKISLGGVAGTLVVAILVGMLGDIKLNDEVKTIAFALFIFTLGYISGPTFVGSLNRQSLKYAAFTVIEIASVLGITAVAILIMRLDIGTAAGLLAGGATESAVVGTATDAIARLPLSDAEIETLQANVGTAYSISYICGLITIVLLSSQIFPLIMRVSLRDEAAKLWKKLGGGADEDSATPAAPRIVGRVYRVETAAGQTVESVQNGLGDATAIERISRAGRSLDVHPDLELAEGDEVLVVGLRDNVVLVRDSIGEEVAGDDITMDIDIAEVVFTSQEYRTTTLGEFKREVSVKDRRGVFLQRVTRGDQDLPVNDGTVIQHGDVVRLVGASRDLDRVIGRVGFRLDPTVKIDLVFISVGIVAGFLIGGLVWQIGNIPLTLGTGGGCLLTGLLFGWIRSKRPTFGQYDPGAADVIKTLGLAVFICAVGLSSGPQAVALVKQFGIGLPIAGVAMTAIPAFVSLFVAWKVMRLPAPLTLGAITGQQCSTPGVTAVQQAAGNATPLMAYTIVYAFSNVALPLLGPVVVAMAHAMGS
ncbi:aspartate-alanine antiporter [Mycolicibacterium boenickei]|uniref:Aspartate-alanine antiporter n=1 Tax=Mycolicibacterium boenickei TaxID=146017 RepID=A0AAX3A0B4_9MYCO|nr:aspartate-alanine antiporter [Mycolicibacterium boenickei]PEG62197.1 aspartate-alanine antiporter [Mycolicibacterium boenickei]UNC00709.1 aspartate-alanine antiporter [Mycolicibacterium boenickei]BBX90488.1 aspartate-alanine antiporter [Mycolicibacterium boenickei]